MTANVVALDSRMTQSVTTGVQLTGSFFPSWFGTVTLPRGTQLEFKAVEVQNGQTIAWENRPNRTFQVPDAASATVRVSWGN